MKKNFFFVLAVLIGITGCEQRIAEQKSDLARYEAELDGTSKTAETHFKLGLLYDAQPANLVASIHHFQRYLELAPDGSHSKEVQQFLSENQLKLAAQLGSGAYISQEESKRLKNENQELQKKNLQLKTSLETTTKALAAAHKALGHKGGLQIQKPLVEGARIYTVVPGDTLAGISRKFYKNNAAKWKEIQEANFEPMEGPAKLKPGMVLMIP